MDMQQPASALHKGFPVSERLGVFELAERKWGG
jgi:hypothetical protein